MINISNGTRKDNPDRLDDQPGRTAATTGAPARTATGGRSAGDHPRRIVVTCVDMLLSWPAAILRHLGDRLFAANDTEAYWRGWQITRVHEGLGRRYRDPLFDTLAECRQCRGAGVSSEVVCHPCQGTGRITVSEVS